MRVLRRTVSQKEHPEMEQKITKISYANDVTLITLSALPSGKAASQVLTAFAASGINVDMISQTAPQGGGPDQQRKQGAES